MLIEKKIVNAYSLKIEDDLYEELEKLVEDVKKYDVNEEVDYVAISVLSIENGVLSPVVCPIISGEKFVSEELEDKLTFRNVLDFTRNDLLPPRMIILWGRDFVESYFA